MACAAIEVMSVLTMRLQELVGIIHTSNIPYLEDNIPLSYSAEVECYSWYNIFTPLERKARVTRMATHSTGIGTYLPRSNYIHKGCLPGSLEEITGKTCELQELRCAHLYDEQHRGVYLVL